MSRSLALNRVTAAVLAVTTALALGLVGIAQAAPAHAAPASGTNVALASAGATVTASGQEEANKWGPDNAIDGDPTTRWSSDHSDTAWITVKLAKPTAIDHVTILWEAACAAQYTLQVSNDGTNFTDATGTISPTCASTDTEKLTKVTAGATYQYVRMQASKRTAIGGSYYGVSLYEFEVWNGPTPVPSQSTADNLVPKPASLTKHPDQAPFTLTATSRIVADAGTSTSANFLATELRSATGYPVPVVSSGAQNGDIVFSTGDVSGYAGQDEAYSLEATTNQVDVTTPTEHGAFDAGQTIRQLLPTFSYSTTPVEANWTIPAVSIVDAPRFAYRGVMLDVARSFLTVGEVEHMLNTMSEFKMSVLHLHLADDQGWRLQITNDGKAPGDPIDYSLLTSVSGGTGMTQEGFNNELGHTGYYTQDDYKAIVAYAAARQITVIPEIDAPGHTNAALHAIPQLNTSGSAPAADPTTGTTPANGTGNVGYSTLDADAPITWTFMNHVLSQLAAITPGKYIHVGGDESAATPQAQYNTFETKVAQIVHGLGKTMIGWNETAVAGLHAGDALQYWTGGTTATMNAVKNDGAKLILSAATASYLDQKYNSSTPIGLTWAGGGDFPTYYNWNPAGIVQDNGANLPDSDILGVEDPMWSETIRGGSQAQFLAFTRSIAGAEIGWTPQAQRSVTDFTTRMASVGDRLLAENTNFYDGTAATWQWSMAGTPVAVAPGHSLGLSVGTLAAPGTEASSDGASIATDTASAPGGASASTVGSGLSATIDWGDGTPTTAATFATATARTALSAGGLYAITGTHSYAAAGTYTGTVTASDGTTTAFTTTVAAGTPDPTVPAPWDSSQTPTLTVDATGNAGGRLAGTLSGFQPGSYVTITIGAANIGTVRPGADGTLALSLPVPAATVAGDYTVTAASGTRTASASVHIDSNVKALKDTIDQKTLAVSSVDSQETTDENSPGTNAIDGDPSTYWHTQYSGPDGASPYPHDIVLDLGKEYDVSGFSYLQRADNSNGRMKDFAVYVGDSADPAGDWGQPVLTGSFQDITAYAQVFEFDHAVTGRYLKLVGLNAINGLAFGGAAEINVGGLPHVTPPAVSLSASQVTAGGQVTVDGEHFAPQSTVTISLNPATPAITTGLVLADAGTTALATDVATDASGVVHTTVTIPSDTAAGPYNLVVSQGGDTPLTATAPLAVTAADSGSGGTGSGGTGSGGTGSGGTGSGGTGSGSTGSDGTGSGSTATGTHNASAASWLASTGSDLVAPIGLAVLALLAGTGIAVIRRRRRA